MRDLIGISGTPGTGKKTVAPLVAGLMERPAAISLNAIAPRRGLPDVDAAELRKRLLKLNPESAVVFGHLLPHVLKKREASFVAVLRCEPSVLRRRLSQRGYPPEKVTENVEAELIGVVLDECLRTFGSDLVHEYETTRDSPEEVAKAIARGARAPRNAKGKGQPWIDWTLRYDSSSKLRSLLEEG